MMETAPLWYWSLSAGLIVYLILNSFLSKTWKRRRLLPPGPFPLPVVGNLLHLRSGLHRSFAGLANIHGPLMTLELGCCTTVVISSANAAREALLNNGVALSGRYVPDCLRVCRHDETSASWIPPTQMWKDLRRFYNTELFSPQKLDASASFRLRKVRELGEFVGRCCDAGQAVDVSRAAYTTVLNLLSNVVFSTDLVRFDSEYSQGFKNLVQNVVETVGSPNIVDFFPILRFIDPQGRRRRQAKLFRQLHDVFDRIIDERRRSMVGGGAKHNDVLDAFFRSNFDQETIRSALTDVFVAGSETNSITVEWAMAELLRNPEAMRKAQTELADAIPPEKEVEEAAIPQLPYLRAVVKETLRLHPPVPLLVPHRAERSVELCGYAVPRDTQVLFNVWAIGRDPSTWTDPGSFSPERFLQGKEIDFRGRHFELIPFGSGRRQCPGLPLADRMVHLMLATLLRSYDWKVPGGVGPGEVEMAEKMSLTMSLASPLLAVPIKRS